MIQSTYLYKGFSFSPNPSSSLKFIHCLGKKPDNDASSLLPLIKSKTLHPELIQWDIVCSFTKTPEVMKKTCRWFRGWTLSAVFLLILNDWFHRGQSWCIDSRWLGACGPCDRLSDGGAFLYLLLLHHLFTHSPFPPLLSIPVSPSFLLLLLLLGAAGDSPYWRIAAQLWQSRWSTGLVTTHICLPPLVILLNSMWLQLFDL